jgi:hypothetical protein
MFFQLFGQVLCGLVMILGITDDEFLAKLAVSSMIRATLNG